MKPTNSLRKILLWIACFLILVISIVILTGCTLGETVMPDPPSGVPVDRAVGAVAPVPAPIPHSLDGREECFACHAIGAVDAPSVPAEHEQDVALCTSCHAVWLAPAIAAVAPPAIPHELENREDCQACHKLGTAEAPRIPDNHDAIASDLCQTCHTQASEITGEGESEAVAESIPSIPHGLEGFSACTQCHEEGGQGIPRFPDDHKGRTDDLCTACHSPAEESEQEASAAEPTISPTETAAAPTAEPTTVSTEPAVEPTGDPVEGQALFSGRCAACHGADGDGTTIAPSPLNDYEFLDSRTDEELADAILMGKDKMPAFPNFTDTEVMDLVAFLRSWQ